jgi:hypothetical protein
MARQDQRVDGGGLAIQSGGDTHYSEGLTAQHMGEIVDAVARQLPVYALMAEKIVSERLKDFKEEIIKRFEEDKTTKSTAFKDPDFQYLLHAAQHAHARSGENENRDVLIDLIAERSKVEARNRLALTINQAVEKASLLTKEELSVLSISFLFRYTARFGIKSIQELAAFLSEHAVPHLSHVPIARSSYQYLEALGCASIEMGEVDIRNVFSMCYPGVICAGFTRDNLIDHLPEGKKDAFDATDIVIPCLDDKSMLQFNALRKEDYDAKLIQFGLDPSEFSNAWNMFVNTVWDTDKISQKLSAFDPSISKIFQLWGETPLKNLTLTSVGMAIGHTNLRLVSGWSADLSIWIN